MLKYWSNAFMTTGSAIIATAIFTDTRMYGVFAGVFCVILGAFLCYLSLLKGGSK